jgi:DNA-binding Lrp family transcriptional regulator
VKQACKKEWRLNDVAKRMFLLIETVVSKDEATINALKRIEGVKSADRVTGPYDVIAVLEGEDLIAIGDLEARIIKLIPYISKAVTCISLSWPIEASSYEEVKVIRKF